MAYFLHKSSNCDIPFQLVTRSPNLNEYRHKDTNEPFHGVAGKEALSFYLFNSEEDFFIPKLNCKLFRYSSAATQAAGMFPIASVNEERGLIYFWDYEIEEWETKGLKLDFLCIPE